MNSRLTQDDQDDMWMIQARIKERAKALEEAGQFRPEETNKQGE